MDMMQAAPSDQFLFFGQLTEDLQLSILSFVAEAPFENAFALTSARTTESIARACQSPLTNILPLVSKQFNYYCQQDHFWKMALLRLLKQDYELWKTGLLNLLSLPQDMTNFGVQSQASNATPVITVAGEEAVPKSPSALLSFLEQILARWAQPGGYHALFRDVVRRYLRCTAPIFFMPGIVKLQEMFRLHLFEPRYRFMISDLFMAYPESCRKGSAIPVGHRPSFLYAFDDRPPPSAGKVACLVHVIRCFVHANGTADVECLPIDFVVLENVWIRQDRGHLFMGQCRRTSKCWQDDVRPQDRIPQQLGRLLERILGQPVVIRPYRTDNNQDQPHEGEGANL